jgi:hypothetical protein
MILHVNHHAKHRYEWLASAWSSIEYPLNDRPKLQELLKEVDVRERDPAGIIAKMPLPNMENMQI